MAVKGARRANVKAKAAKTAQRAPSRVVAAPRAWLVATKRAGARAPAFMPRRVIVDVEVDRRTLSLAGWSTADPHHAMSIPRALLEAQFEGLADAWHDDFGPAWVLAMVASPPPPAVLATTPGPASRAPRRRPA